MTSVVEASPCAMPPPGSGELAFASCYAYSPDVRSPESRVLRSAVKAGDVRRLVDRAIRRDFDPPYVGSLAQFFPADAILVPIPGCAAQCVTDYSATGRLALELTRQRLGVGVWFGLRRIASVRKSGTAPHGSRPSVRAHFESMVVQEAAMAAASAVVLIDDVVTKGRTLLAAALRLREALPQADIRAFALLRTLGYARIGGGPLMPCIGHIDWKRDDARRSP